jgi:hypothetical protein
MQRGRVAGGAAMRFLTRFVRLGILVVYGLVIPLLAAHTLLAHRHFVNWQGSSRWAYSVDRSVNPDRLSIWNQNTTGTNVTYAMNSWDNTNSGLRFRYLSSADRSKRDVKTARYGEPNSPRSHGCYRETWLGLYDYKGPNDPDVIYINYCMAFWEGGIWPITGEHKGATSQDRRLRSYVHEMGHALGLDHNDLGQCGSVMRDIQSDAAAICYGVQEHDRDDMQAYW